MVAGMVALLAVAMVAKLVGCGNWDMTWEVL